MLAGCAGPEAQPPDPDRPFRLVIEDIPAASVFSREGSAVRDRPDGAAGSWAVIRGLPRPERAEVVNLESGAVVVVALFSSRSGPDIRLSNEAADALGIDDTPIRVRVTALRSQPVLDTTRSRF